MAREGGLWATEPKALHGTLWHCQFCVGLAAGRCDPPAQAASRIAPRTDGEDAFVAGCPSGFLTTDIGRNQYHKHGQVTSDIGCCERKWVMQTRQMNAAVRPTMNSIVEI